MENSKTIKFTSLLLSASLIVPLVSFFNFFGSFSIQKITIFEMIIEVLFPVIIFLIIKNKNLIPKIKKPGPMVFLLFFFWIFFSSIFGVDVLNSIFGNSVRHGGLIFQLHLFLFVFYLIVAFKIQPTLFKKMAQLSIAIAIPVSIYGLLESLNLITVFDTEFLPRARSTIGNPIFLASYLFFPFIFSIIFLIKEKIKWPYVISIIVILLGFYSSGTRGAYVGFFVGAMVGLLFFALKKINKKRKKILLGTLILVFFAFLFTTLINSNGANFINKLRSSEEASIMDRVNYWGIATKVISDAPVFGVGYENFYYLAEKYYQTEFYDGEGKFFDKPHNQFLETLSTSGIPGAILYLLFFAALIKIIIQKQKVNQFSLIQASILIAGLVAYHVQNAFVFDTESASIMYFFFVAYLLSHEQSQEHPPVSDLTSPNNLIFWSSIILTLFLFVVFHNPSIQEFRQIQKSRLATSPQESVQELDKLKDNLFIFNESEIAKEYLEVANRSIGIRIEDKELYKKISNEAESYYKKAIEKHPDRSEYNFHLGRSYMVHATATGDEVSEEQMQVIKKSIELLPERVEPKIIRINVLDLQGKRELALEEALKLYEIAPLSGKVLWTIAILYIKDDQPSLAAEFGKKALVQELDPNSKIELMWFFDYHINRNEFEDAILFLKAAIKIDPTDLDLVPKLAAAYAANGEKEKALETAVEFIKNNPSEKEGGEAFIQQLLSQ